MGRLLALTLLCGGSFAALAVSGCGDDDPNSGFRSECAYAGGLLLDCESPPIETTEDACWRFVECGAIPLESDNLDFQGCMNFLDDQEQFRKDYIFRCIQSATCDDLKANGGPNDTYSRPLCLRYGDD